MSVLTYLSFFLLVEVEALYAHYLEMRYFSLALYTYPLQRALIVTSHPPP